MQRRFFDKLQSCNVSNRALLNSRLKWYYVDDKINDPPFCYFLDDSEIDILVEWFVDTTDNPFIGDSGFVAISMLSTLILNNRINQAVQLGHYAGFGSLILGFMLRKVSHNARLVSFDIDYKMTQFCNELMKRAGLSQIVQHVCIDSTDPLVSKIAGKHLTGKPGLVFIDASKQYHNTIFEVDLWTKYTNGYIVCHDVSQHAKSDQANGTLGVDDGLIDSKCFKNYELLIIDPAQTNEHKFPYLDPCGLSIGLSRGTLELPHAETETIDSLLLSKSICNNKKLINSENWFVGDGIQHKQSKLFFDVTAQGGSWATCFAPIEPGMVLKYRIEVSDSNGTPFMICAGGPPGSSNHCLGDGVHFGTFTAGLENSRIGIYAPKGCKFNLSSIELTVFR